MNILFNMREVYTKDVIAAAIHQLLDEMLIAPLLMRTVIQVLKIHLTLLGFVVNVLQRLIPKQVGRID